MNNYIHIIDTEGNRITSVVDNMLEPIGEDALRKQAEEQYPNAAQYLYGGDEMLDEFLGGKIYKNGKFVDKPVVEPSADEIKKTKVAEIKAKYEEKFKKDEAALVRARLAGNDKTVEQLQARYKANMLAMAKEIKEI